MNSVSGTPVSTQLKDIRVFGTVLTVGAFSRAWFRLSDTDELKGCAPKSEMPGRTGNVTGPGAVRNGLSTSGLGALTGGGHAHSFVNTALNHVTPPLASPSVPPHPTGRQPRFSHPSRRHGRARLVFRSFFGTEQDHPSVSPASTALHLAITLLRAHLCLPTNQPLRCLRGSCRRGHAVKLPCCRHLDDRRRTMGRTGTTPAGSNSPEGDEANSGL